MEQLGAGRVARAGAWPRRVLAGLAVQAKNRYWQLKKRYGPRYTNAMLSAAFIALFVPLPGSSLVGVAVIAAVAEAHRAVAHRDGLPEAVADLVVVVKANLPCWATGRWPSPPG